MMIEAIDATERARPGKASLMNDQVAAQLRQFLQIMGTLLTTVGIIKPGIADTWIPIIMQVAGPIMMLASILWSMKANTKASIIQSASAMPEVKSMTITDPALAEAARTPETPARVLLKDEESKS
jgi:hypothetical protein